MSQERIEAAARAAAKDEDASNWDDEHDYYRNGWFNRMAVGIEAADAALFSDEAIERAAKKSGHRVAVIRAVVDALRGEA